MSDRILRLPPCGIFIGSAIYVSFADYTIGLGRLFTCWNPEDHAPEWYLDKTIEENQGNIVQLWPNCLGSQLKAAAWWRGMFKDGVDIPQPDWKNRKMLSPGDWPEIARNDARFGEGMVDFIEKRQLNPNASGEEGLLHKSEALAFHIDPYSKDPWITKLQY